MMVYRLRPHHGLCIRFFEGKGYSEEFTVHMTQVIPLLEDNARIELVKEADEICSACPNWNGQVCESQDKVVQYDETVLSLTGLQEKQQLSYQDFQDRIQQNVFDEDCFAQVCGDCEWGEICHRG